MVQDVKHAPIALNLLSGISEHLQASLQEIFEHSQRLQRQAKEEDRAPVCLSDVEAISSGCANVLSAVNQLMDLVQLERETAEFLEQDVRVQDVLERAYLGSCEVARRQGAALRMCNLAPDAVVSADPRRVQQILISLVNAALSHTRDDALIELTAKANEDGGLEISVATGEPPVRPQMRSTAVDSGSVEAAPRKPTVSGLSP